MSGDTRHQGFETEPLIEAVLMKYYNQNAYGHSIPDSIYLACEYDIKTLVWLSRITLR